MVICPSDKFSRKTLSNFDQRALAGYEEFARGNQINEKRRNRLNEKKRYSYGNFVYFRLIFEPSYWKQPLTVSKKKIGWSKFGFLCVFLIMDDWMVLPPHSNSILGDETFANWNFFMFLTPQQRTYTGEEHVSKRMLRNHLKLTKSYPQ